MNQTPQNKQPMTAWKISMDIINQPYIVELLFGRPSIVQPAIAGRRLARGRYRQKGCWKFQENRDGITVDLFATDSGSTELLRSSLVRFNRAQQSLPKGVEASWFQNFFSVEIGYVEYVNDLIEMGADFGHLQVEVLFIEDLCDRVEKSSSIVGKYGNDGVIFRSVVVELHLSRLVSNRITYRRFACQMRRKFGGCMLDGSSAATMALQTVCNRLAGGTPS